MIKKNIKSIFAKLGYEIKAINSQEYKRDKDFQEAYNTCKTYTLTSPMRMHALYKAVKYITENSIPGDFVECGVWRGGSSMLMAKALIQFGDTNRNLYLYDTFEGMPPPSEDDKDFKGKTAKELMNDKSALKDKKNSVWCEAGLEEVRANMQNTHYPSDKIHYIKGKVEETIPQIAPNNIALLRLDTDWYESTYHELKHLYPLIEEKGILIQDDYGHWQGAKKATDDFFLERKIAILFNNIDDSGVIAVKTSH